MLTFVLDDRSFATAGRADTLGLHHAEDALCGMGDDARSVTGRTLFAGAASLGTSAVTVRASDVLAYLKLLGDAVCYLLQRQTDFQSQVTAAVFLG